MAVLSRVTWILLSVGAVGCGPKTVDPLPELPEVPAYTLVPHPQSHDYSEVKALMAHPQAPAREDLKDCDRAWRELEERTASSEERKRGASELVTREPVALHWCFYEKVRALHEVMGGDALWSVRQKQLIETYGFLVPIAQAYRVEFKDTRYLRWAMKDYMRMSEWVFFRKLELTPDATKELVEGTSNPFALTKKPQEEAVSVLEKYHVQVRPIAAPVSDVRPIAAPVSDVRPIAAPSESAEQVDPVAREPAEVPQDFQDPKPVEAPQSPDSAQNPQNPQAPQDVQAPSSN